MKRSQRYIPRWLPAGLLILGGLLCVLLLWRLSSNSNVGKGDFVGYWSATYLFRAGQNPYDPVAMETFQLDVLKTGLDSTVMAWNPPSLFVLLLPLSWLSFSEASSVWLIVNMAIIIASALMLARLYLPENNGGSLWIYMLAALTSPQILSGIYMGQVTFLVLLGLAGCMALIKRGQWFWAGAVLILITIKPHLVVLSGIYLLLYMAKKRQYQGWLGLFLAGILTIGVLFVFRPGWIGDLIGEMSIAPVHWLTPTIGGLLSYWGVTEAARYMIILLLPLPFVLLKYEDQLNMKTAVALLTLITLPTTFFGWHFDQVLLLIPAMQILAWMKVSERSTANALISAAIAIALIPSYYLRNIQSNDVYFVWVPLLWWILFLLAWYVFRSSRNRRQTSGIIPIH